MPNKIFRSQELRGERIGVNQNNPVHTIDVSGDVYSNAYQFGGVVVDHSDSQVIDFDGNTFQSLSLTGDLSLSTTNRASDTNKIKSITVRIIGDTVDRDLSFNSSIKFIGNLVYTGSNSGTGGRIKIAYKKLNLSEDDIKELGREKFVERMVDKDLILKSV